MAESESASKTPLYSTLNISGVDVGLHFAGKTRSRREGLFKTRSLVSETVAIVARGCAVTLFGNRGSAANCSAYLEVNPSRNNETKYRDLRSCPSACNY